MATELGDPWESLYHFSYKDISKLVHPSGSGSDTYFQDVDQDGEAVRALSFAIVMHYYLTESVLCLLNLKRYLNKLEDVMKAIISRSQVYSRTPS